jgi:hypothetical protein
MNSTSFQKGHKVSDEIRKKISQTRKERIANGQINLENVIKSRLGSHHSDLTKKIISENTKIAMDSPSIKLKCGWCKGKTSTMKGKKHSMNARKKMRISALNYIEKSKGKPYCCIGKSEAQLLDEQEIKNNCKIQRQFHIRDLGYIVDGYCLETNTVYEVYEPRHDNQVQKDFQRETEIYNHLSCDFIILWTGDHNAINR